MLTQADGAYRAGDLVSARQIWEAVLQMEPQNQPARAGLQLTQLVDSHWSQLDRSSAGDAALQVQLARVRELLDSGLTDDAAAQAAALAVEHPEDPAVLALKAEIQQTLQLQPLLRHAIDQARAQIASGQASMAVKSCRDALKLEPGNREAELLLEQAERAVGTSPATGSSMPMMELDLDLSLAAKPPTPSAQRETVRTMPQAVHSTSPQKRLDDDAPSMRDLLEAASDIETGEQDVSEWLQADPLAESGAGDPAAAESTSDSRHEAQRLVEQAREALREGNVDRATQLASRGMALWDGVPGAAELMEQARDLASRRAQELESLMQQAINAFEKGQNDQAVPLFNQVLKQAPGHREAKDYLARITTAVDDEALKRMMQAASNSQALFETDLLALDGKSPSPVPVGVAPALPPIPVSVSKSVPAPREPATAELAARAPVPAETPARIVKPDSRKGGADSASSLGSRRVPGGVIKRLVVLSTGLGLLVAGAWWFGAIDMLFGDSTQNAAIQSPVAKKKPSSPKADASAASIAPTPAPSAPAPPSFGPSDVPELRRKARVARDESNYEQSVAYLQSARVAEPTNFDVADELNAAQQLLQQQQTNLARLKEAKATWRLQDYEEAMRLLYRLPKEMQPPRYNHWLANGWYNLGVLALQRGDVGEALQFFHDGLELNSSDVEMERHREVAKRYRGKRLDATFSTYANGIALREMED